MIGIRTSLSPGSGMMPQANGKRGAFLRLRSSMLPGLGYTLEDAGAVV